jgi:LysR family transcriptional regulator, regulator of abg operon
MKLHHIRNIVAIVERGSLRAAAKHLGLAQPAMSRSVRELEQELGATLFERNRSGMTLTAVGEVFFRRARAIQAEFQRTLDEVAQLKGTGFGTLSVALSGATLLALFPRMIGPFRSRYPNIRIKVIEATLPMLETEVRDGLVDLYYGPVPEYHVDPALVIDLMFENERIIVARREHPLRFATTLEELGGASWVTTPVAVDTDIEVNSMFDAVGLPPPHIAMQAASNMSLAIILATTDLLAPVPQQWLDLINASDVLVRIPVRERIKAPRICAVRRANMPLTPVAQYLNDLAFRAAGVHAQALEARRFLGTHPTDPRQKVGERGANG